MKTNRVLRVREIMQQRNILSTVAVLLSMVVFAASSALAVDDPDSEFMVNLAESYVVEAYVVTSGTAEASSSCPSWFEAFDREGGDGGSLKVELNACEVPLQYTIYSWEQGVTPDETVDLEIGDLIIVWDEDAEHGENEEHKAFDFNGEYVADPDCSYVRASSPYSDVNWMFYRVLESGTLTITNTGLNEHDAIHFEGIDFWKDDGVDDLDCVRPRSKITYTICWEELNNLTLEDVRIIDYLPDGVSYAGGHWETDPLRWIVDTNYDPNNHTYTWDIGTIYPYDANCVSLTVTVNRRAEPGLELHNEAELVSGGNTLMWAFEDTLVCCWDAVDPDIIYVDETATGFNTGTIWIHAYTNLQDALYRAENTNCAAGGFTVYVAQGIYKPGLYVADTYELPDNVSLYGGFKTGGCNFSERNPRRYKTILTGQIDGIGPADVDTVVTMGDNTLLDGFTVTKSKENAIYGNGVDFTIENCVIGDSEQYGIRTIDGDVTVKWCKISKCGFHGIRHEGDGYTLTVENSWIMRNQQYGIYSINSTPTIKNSIISESDLAEEGRQGIRIVNPAYSPVLYNNTIANNRAEGIFFTDNADASGDPNDKDWPDVQNCIVYYNNPGGDQVAGFSVDTYANFCSIQDCNELDTTTNYNDEPGFAYTVDPNGTPDPENYHLAYDSFCIDKANPFMTYTGQVDMDGEGIDRKYGSAVDIGADEVYDCKDDDLSEADISNPLDWNADGIVNYEEFSKFSAAWLCHDPNDPAWIADPNLADPSQSDGWYEWKYVCNLDATGTSQYQIDIADLEVFLSDTPWLWIACWKLEEINAASQASAQTESMMGLPFEMSSMSASTAPEPKPEVSVDGLVQLVGFLDEIAADNPDNVEAIQKIRDDLMDQIEAIINEENQ